MTGCFVNNELKERWNKVVMAKFEVLFQHLTGGSEQNNENISP
jgi:hypothetical protein